MSLSYTTSDSNLEIAPPSTVELLWINHRNAIIGSLAALVVIGAVVLGVLWSMNNTRIASETLLAGATDDAGWNAVIAQYPHTPAAADAMLLLAASLRDAGKIDASNELYSRFAEEFPNSPLAVSGLIGRASNARVTGHPDQAVSSYQQAVETFQQSYGAPFSLFVEIQLLAQQGKIDDAKRLLQALMSQYPSSAAAQTFGGGRAPQTPPENSESSSASAPPQ